MSCDGGAVAASVRDAALRALQSSDSIRSRLVHTDSTAEDCMRVMTSGAQIILQSCGYGIVCILIYLSWVVCLAHAVSLASFADVAHSNISRSSFCPLCWSSWVFNI